MTVPETNTIIGRTLRFHGYGEPADVLQLEETAVPSPGQGQIRVRVAACGLNPADWALCRGLFAGHLPRGIGLEVAGTVEAVSPGVTDVAVGDPVLGVPDWADCEVAGASDVALLNHWARLPEGLDPVQAAALPMATETACRSLDYLGMTAGQTLLVHGAGTTVGFATVQIALRQGIRVIATAGPTFADQLRAFGASVTPYGDGMVARVREIAGGSPDLILDTAPPSGVLPALVEIAGGDTQRVLTITDFAEAKRLGLRQPRADMSAMRYDVLGEYAQLAAEGKFTVPVARTFPLADWRQAINISQGGHAHGKLVLLPAGAAAAVGR